LFNVLKQAVSHYGCALAETMLTVNYSS